MAMFSNDKNIETIAQLVEALKDYVELQKDYLKLDVVEKAVRLLTAVSLFDVPLRSCHNVVCLVCGCILDGIVYGYD